MFSDEELELIEELVGNYGETWCQTTLELKLLDSILLKIDKALNG